MLKKISLIVFVLFPILILSIKLSGSSSRVIPLDKWERNKRVDRKVKKIIEKMNWWAKKAEDLDDLGWNLEFVRLGTKLYKTGISGLPEMVEEIKNEDLDWKTRLSIISTIPRLKGIDSVKTVIISALGKILLDKGIDKRVREAICTYGFEIMKDTSATPYLIQTMEDKSNPEKVRWWAVHAFVFIPDERAVKPLLENIERDPSLEIRKISISALGAIGKNTGNRDMVPRLLEIVRDKGKNPLRYFAISMLGSMKEKSVIPLLVEAIQKNDRRDLYVIIWALSNIETQECEEALLDLLEDKDEGIRFEAAKALIKMKDKSVIPEVEKSLSNFKDEGYKRVIKKSLMKLKESKEGLR